MISKAAECNQKKFKRKRELKRERELWAIRIPLQISRYRVVDGFYLFEQLLIESDVEITDGRRWIRYDTIR